VTETLEQRIGRLEREFDKWREQVAGFERTVEHYKINNPNYLGLSKIQGALEEARSNFEGVREELESARTDKQTIEKTGRA
jgi:hypothetical protein